MKRESLDLARIPNWPELAAKVHYHASLLATLLKVNPRRLQREFRRELKTTPQRYLDQMRLTEAKKMAAQRMRTKEISVRLEYKQASHLCRQFHAQFGTALSAIRDASPEFGPTKRPTRHL